MKLWHPALGRPAWRHRRGSQQIVTLSAFEPEARLWCQLHGLDPDAQAPAVVAGLGRLDAESYWIRRARQIRIAAEDRADRLRRQRPAAA